MTTATINYAAAATLTMTLAALATDASLLAGRESTAVDNTTNLYVDALVGGKVTSHASVAPTAGKQIEVWAYGTYDGTTYSGGCTGSDNNLTFASEKTMLKLLTIIPTDASTAHTYEWGPFSVAQAFGGTMPQKWGIYMVQNTGQALNATAGNHEVKYTGIKFVSS
jgi:hypothetical protein